MHRFLVAATGCLALVLGACGGSKNEGGGGGGSGGTDDPTCEIDLASYTVREGEGTASIRQIKGGADLVEGAASRGRVGDWLLENGKIRAVVQGVHKGFGADALGGKLVDVDIARPSGEGKDVLGAVSPLFNFGRTLAPKDEKSFTVVADGKDGKAVVLKVEGADALHPGVDLVRSVNGSFTGSAKLMVDPKAELGEDVTVTQYYILAPGAHRIRSVTAFCNAGEVTKVIPVGDLVEPGTIEDRFSPSGWGAAAERDDVPWIAFQGDDSAYALVPGDGKGPNLLVSTDGFIASVQGSNSLQPYTKPLDPQKAPKGAVVVPPEKSAIYERSIVVGTSISDVTEGIFAMRREQTGRVTGKVTGGYEGAGARVAVVDEGQIVTVFTADAEGRFDAIVPVGTYTLSASLPGLVSPAVEATISSENDANVTLELPAAGRFWVKMRAYDPRNVEAAPSIPGRVVVRCKNGPCPSREGEWLFRDMETVRYPADTVAYVGYTVGPPMVVDLPVGSYDYILSGGPEYESYPMSFASDGKGMPITVTAGQLTPPPPPPELGVPAQPAMGIVARIVNTKGWISTDLRARSNDSRGTQVSRLSRVQGLVGDGIELAISADTDRVTDLGPTAELLEANRWVRTVTGSEMAPTGLGRMTVFPLNADSTLPGNGAIAWTGADGLLLSPNALFESALGRDAKVILINNARGPGGLFTNLKLDTDTLATHADPGTLGMMQVDGASSDDTGLFSKNFHALEVMGSSDPAMFKTMMNDWLTFLSQGLVVTGTASSGANGRVNPSPGTPRTWVYVGDGKDTADKVEMDTFYQSLKAGRVVAGNGPFITVKASSGGNTVGPGEVLASNGALVRLDVTVQSPMWMKYNRIEVYSHKAGREAAGGMPNESWPIDSVATQADGSGARFEVDMTTTDGNEFEDFVDSEGLITQRQKKMINKSFTFQPEADTYYVVVVRTVTDTRDGLRVMEPVPADLAPLFFDGEKGVRPMAFANPVYIDVDGGGYNNFPAGR
ncbi:carboxypeptidase regulatory-like domain-containing protein [Vulgatibacter incomptus]|uniref:Carboxypeptidase regulatory-like domain-containing protein n=1 Tax=Vulgatibacter incomptus TaxID=1391653 RepID=A0A0K1PE03_9BACT|nr:carboxypeptidase regulatory-like domain-containing protein [Vulgatibacter incomptus]AKU91722.1 hypothetical protein AKJ08_2109 [Vulgatibacter incomptus]